MEINSVLQSLSLEGARLKQDETMYKSSEKRLTNLLSDDDELWEPVAVLGVYLSLLRNLKLIQSQHGEYAPTDNAEGWFTKHPEEQMAAIVEKLENVAYPPNKYFWNKILELTRHLPAQQPCDTRTVFSHLLLSFMEDVSQGKEPSKFMQGFVDLGDLADATNEWVRDLEHYGILEVYRHKNRAVGVKLTQLGALALGAAELGEQPTDEKTLIVNPDFECIVFRHGPAWRVAAVLSRFARKEKTDQTYHFKIAREQVESAVLCGMSADSMLGFLREHSRTPIPQNVQYSLKDWASKVHVARNFSAIILEVKEPEILDVIMEDPEVKPHIVRRLSPTLAALKQRLTGKKLLTRLRQNGVFLKY